ncbi:signal peptidase I [Scrofimicrobium sp. R131]|uniref:Signal peptidase I n=1 Tax=Scrofimicrobium appendicitidis TaxID=3079930 RepID=A0AAU7VBB4_9ACTO
MSFLSRRTAQHKAAESSEGSWWSWVREVLIVLILALVISTLLRHFVVQVYSIPSPSMVPTLQVGDRIVVDRIPGSGKDIHRGDVVVFEDSQGWMASADQGRTSFLRPIGEFLGLVPANGEQIIVKRVIGVGGDQVACCTAEGQLTVNGTPISEEYLPDGEVPSRDEFEVTVPEGHYWVMGDNRSHSADSLYHYQRGEQPFIADQDVIGRVWSVIWPVNHWSSVSHRDAFADVG